MKKVIFICLLSLSVCLSQSADVPNNTTNKAVTGETGKKNEAASSTPVQPGDKAGGAPQGNEHTKQAVDTGNKDAQAPGTGQGTKPTNGTDITPKPTDIKNNSTLSPSVPPPTTNSSNTSTNTSSINPNSQNTNSSQTPVSPTPSGPNGNNTTQSPNNDKTSEKEKLQARGFDGASFIGGIILTLGLLAIGFMGFKYYKNQTERNYHTL